MFRRQPFHGQKAICAAIALAVSMPVLALAQDATAPAAGSDAAKPAAHPPGKSHETTDLSAVTVTANKRSERVLDVPMAVSALNGGQLDRESAQSFADYATRVPGLNTVTIGPGQTQLTLRGITSGSNTPNATVGTYIDDTPFGSSTVYAAGAMLTPDIDPDDVDRIEVLRGPQGTLYGSNTLGGLVKFVTTPPDSTRFAGRVQVGGSSVSHGGDGFDTHAMINLPLVKDELALRVNAFARHDPGYIDNVANGKKDTNDAEVRGGRAQLLWTPSSTVSVRLAGLAQNLDGDALANAGVQVYPVSLRPIYGDLRQSLAVGTGKFGVRYRLYSADVSADFGWATLVSSTSYGKLDKRSDTDTTFAYGPLVNPLLGLDNGAYSISNPMELNKVTQELRLQSATDQAVEWRAGVFFTREHTTNVQDVNVFDATTGVPIALPETAGHVAVGPAKFKEWAGYADITWHATSRFAVTVGGRYSHDSTEFHETSYGLLAPTAEFTQKSTDKPSTYLVNPTFKFNDNLMVYGRIASSFRPGGANTSVLPGTDAPKTFDQDRLVNYELGLKSSSEDKRSTVEVAAFLIDWKDIQLAAIAGGVSFLSNGGKARSRGLEASWNYVAANGLVFSTNATWTRAELTSDTPPGLFGRKGDRLPYVPKLNANVGIDYDFPIGEDWSAFVGGSYRYVGDRVSDFSTEEGPRFAIPSYSAVDLRAGVYVGDFTFKAYVKNVFDKRGVSSIGPETLDPRASPFSARYIVPRTVGVSASVDF
ncbi:TonB-dependent receptor [Luteibacter jiangsuensis]